MADGTSPARPATLSEILDRIEERLSRAEYGDAFELLERAKQLDRQQARQIEDRDHVENIVLGSIKGALELIDESAAAGAAADVLRVIHDRLQAEINGRMNAPAADESRLAQPSGDAWRDSGITLEGTVIDALIDEQREVLWRVAAVIGAISEVLESRIERRHWEKIPELHLALRSAYESIHEVTGNMECAALEDVARERMRLEPEEVSHG